MPITLNGDTGITTPSYGGADTAEYLVPVTAFKNRIFNGAMTISQYYGTSSVTPTNDIYVIDRFKAVRSQNNLTYQQNAGSVTPPVGFTNYLGITATTGATIGGPDYWYLYHFIEGFNSADLQWGTANAKTVTLSFWVRASVTGSYSVGFHNGAEDRAYLAPYTISAANTWEYKTITLTGDTTGTWVGATNGKGLGVWFNLGVGSVFGTSTTNSWINGWNPGLTTGVQFAANAGATFYITGIQLEVGSTATSFDYRPYGTELQLCQRYYETGNTNISFFADQFGNAVWQDKFIVEKRATGTLTYNDQNGNTGKIIRWFASSFNTNVTPTGLSTDNTKTFSGYIGSLSGGTLVRVAFNWFQNSEL